MEIKINDLLDVYENEVSRNTKNKNKIYHFEKYKMTNIINIKEEIESNTYNIGKYNIFSIYEPKLRIIMSLSIKDRIVDHYIAKYILIPKVEKYLDIRNVASRKNKGISYGLKLLKKYIEENKKYENIYILKLDISKYFYSINHSILKSMLKEILTEEEYNLVSIYIDSTDAEYVNKRIYDIKNNLKLKIKNEKQIKEIEDIPYYNEGCGLTIGNVCSQILSIYYLSRLDFHIIHNLKCKYMIRYCDDIIVFSKDKDYLKDVYIKINKYLENYKLKLNEKKSFIVNIKNGFIFCGNYVKLKNKKTIIKKCYTSRYKIKKNIKKKYKLYMNNKITFKEFFLSYSSYNLF